MTGTNVKKRVGLAVMDIQTLHRGHNNLLNEMRMSCDEAVIGLGSVRKFGTPGHPFTFEQRAEMVRTIHGDYFSFVALDDIDASRDITEWYSYVSAKIEKAGLPEPTDYFGGSRIDANWYFHAFASPDTGIEHASPIARVYENPESGRRLHLVDRSLLGLPSGREVRLLIEMRDPEWKAYVPERLHAFVEQAYPPHLRYPLQDPEVHWHSRSGDVMGHVSHDELMEGITAGEVIVEVSGEYPVGTRLCASSLMQGEREGKSCELMLELKDDGRWRPLDTRDEKAEWAIASMKGN